MKRNMILLITVVLPMIALVLLALPGCVIDHDHDHGGAAWHDDHHEDHVDFDHH
jgi:hypothetical protein